MGEGPKGGWPLCLVNGWPQEGTLVVWPGELMATSWEDGRQ